MRKAIRVPHVGGGWDLCTQFYLLRTFILESAMCERSEIPESDAKVCGLRGTAGLRPLQPPYKFRPNGDCKTLQYTCILVHCIPGLAIRRELGLTKSCHSF